MAINYDIFYHQLVVDHDIPKLSPAIKATIKKALEYKLRERPEVFGKPLRRSLKNYRKLRVGDYHIIFWIEGIKVKILIIAHRSLVYEKVFNRI